MPSLTEEILVTLQGRDNASQVVNSFASNAESTLNGVSSGASGMGDAYSSTFDNIGKGIHTLNSGMISLSSLNRTVMSELGSSKSAMDWVYGTTSKEDTNKVLVGNMAKTQEEYDSLYTTIDKVTDNSLTSMQELIPALNAFRSATQATAGQLESDVTQDMAQFGAFVLAQTGSTQLALTAMMDLSKGIKGRYASLDQYGISAEALKATGKWREAEGGSKTKNWTGDEKDIKGYMDAVVDVIGSTDDLMNTNEGLNAQMGKMWSRAGKRIGHEMMPGLKSLKQMFIDMDTEMHGDLSTGVLRVALAIEEAQQKAYTLNTLYDATRNLSSIVKSVATHFGLMSAETGANTAQTQANSRAIQNNTNMLLANTDARLANAEAMGMAGNAQMMDTGATGSSGMKEMAEYTAMDMGGDALLNKALGGSPYGNDAIGQEIQKRKKYLDSQKELEDIEASVSSRWAVVDYWRNKRSNKRETHPKSHLEELAKETQKEHDDAQGFYKVLTGNFNIPEEYRDNGAVEFFEKGIKDTNDELSVLEHYVGEEKKIRDVMDSYNPDMVGKAGTEALKKHGDDAIRDMHPPTTLTGLVKGKVDGFGEALQDGLEQGFTGLGDSTRNLKKKANLGNIKNNLDELFFDYEELGVGIEKRKLKAPKMPKIPSLNELNEKLGSSVEGFSFKGLKDKLTGLRGAKEVVDVADDVEDVMSSGEKIASSAGKAGAVGGEMASATGGLSFMALSEMGLAGAFQALIVPTLAIAGVIAVMIPVVAGLAIEALYFINLVAQVMSAMNFGDIDISGASESLQEIATALAWLGVTMASLTFVGITGAIGMATAGLLQIVGGIPALVSMVETIGYELEPLNSLSIDDSAVENLQNIGNILNNMSQVMLSLSGLQLSVGLSTVLDGFGLFSRVFGDAITRAKTDISRAIEAINGINFGSIDASKVEQVKNTMEAIKAFSDAFSGLTKIRTDNAISDFVAWLLDGGIFGQGGKSISEAFELAHKDIVDASKSIQSFTDVSDIDQTTVDRLSKVGEAIKAMGDAFEGLRKIRDDSNWDAMFEDGGLFQAFQGKYDIATALDMAKGTMVNISKSLKSLDGRLADIPDGVAKKLQKVADTLTSVTGILDNLKKLKEDGGNQNKNFDDYVETIKSARSSLVKVSGELKSLDGKGGLSEIKESVITKLNNVTKTLKSVSKSVKSLKGISDDTDKGKDFSDYETMIKNARGSLVNISGELKNLDGKGGLATISDGVVTKLKTVTTTLKNISKAVESLGKIQGTAGTTGENFGNYQTLIQNAKVGLENVSQSLKEMKIKKISGTTAKRVRTVTKILFNISKALVNLQEIDNGMGNVQEDGFKKYQDLISNAKTGLEGVSQSLKEMKIKKIDTAKVGQIKKVTKTLKAINDAMSEMKSIFEEFGGDGENQNGGNGQSPNSLFVNNGQQGEGNGQGNGNIENFKTSVKNSITAISEIAGQIKPMKKDKNLQGLGGIKGRINNLKNILSALSGSANVMQGFPFVDGHNIGYRVGRAVTGLKRASGELKKLNEGDKVGGNIKGVIKNIKSALKDLQRAVEATNLRPAGVHVGSKLVGGIGTGMNNLTTVVVGKINSSTQPSANAGWSMGTAIADKVNQGFASALRLVEIISQQIQQAQTSAVTGANNTNTTAQGTAQSGDTASSPFVNPSNSPQSANQEQGENSGGAGLVFRNTRRMLNNMSSNFNNLNLNRLNSNRRNGLSEMNQKSKMGQGNPSVNIIVGEGAVQVDSRNLTKKESRQVMINALEGLDMIQSINLKGNTQ